MMRKTVTIAAFVCLSSAGLAAAADDYLVITGVAAQDGNIYLDVQSTGDLDGDGVPDDAVLRLQCAGGDLRTADYTVKSPRDAGSSQPSGKRTHKPVTFVKEWGAATPQLAKLRPGYNIKESKGARMPADGGGWTAIDLSNADGICAAATTAARATKTRSNIQNN